jgi:hypothetical protein
MFMRQIAAQFDTVPPETLTCPRCGFVTHNPNDVQQQYCGFCRLFLQDSAAVLMSCISPANQELRARLNVEADCLYARSLPDGRALAVFPVTGGEAVLRICYDGDPGAPKESVAWMYENRSFAVNAAATWDPQKEREPYGWHWSNSGRWRPHGDPHHEYTPSVW